MGRPARVPEPRRPPRPAAARRRALIRDLVDATDGHLVLVTATPHSGKEETFRSVFALLDPDLAELPADFVGEE